MAKKKPGVIRQVNPEKNPKVWEKARRERMKVFFEELVQLLPLYDPSNPMSRFEVLKKTICFIKDLQTQNQELLNGGFDEVYKEKMDKLKQRIKELLHRVDQLSDLLKVANISLPPCPLPGAGGYTDTEQSKGEAAPATSTSWLHQRPKKWTEKLNLVVPKERIDRVMNLIKDHKKKTKVKRKEVKKKMEEKKKTEKPFNNDNPSPSQTKENEPIDFNRQKNIAKKTPKTTAPIIIPPATSVVQPSTYILTNDGNLVPILNQNSGILTPLVINRPPPLIVLQKPIQTAQIVTKPIQILGNSLVCTAPQPLPCILTKTPANKKRITRDSTVTTYVNRIPIPTPAKQGKTKGKTKEEEKAKQESKKVDCSTQVEAEPEKVEERKRGVEEDKQEVVKKQKLDAAKDSTRFKPIPEEILHLPVPSLSVSPTAAFLSTFPIVAATKADELEEISTKRAEEKKCECEKKDEKKDKVEKKKEAYTHFSETVPTTSYRNTYVNVMKTHYEQNLTAKNFDCRKTCENYKVYQEEPKYQLVPTKEPERNTRAPVNWMTDPPVPYQEKTFYQKETFVPENYTENKIPYQNKDKKQKPQNSYNIFDYNYNYYNEEETGKYCNFPKKKSVKKKSEHTVHHVGSEVEKTGGEHFNHQECFSWVPAKNVDWMPNKCFGVEGNLTVPSTLPTLVGDLALGTTTEKTKTKELEIPATFPKMETPLEPFTNLSKNIFDVTNSIPKPDFNASNETIVLKNIFELPVTKNRTRAVNNPQNTFLSVSQLVDNQNLVLEPPKPDYPQNYNTYPKQHYKNKRNPAYRKFHGYKNTNYTAEALIRSNFQNTDFPNEPNQCFNKQSFNEYTDFNFSSPVPNFNLTSTDFLNHDNNFTSQNNFIGDYVPSEYPLSESVSNSLLLPPCSIGGLQNPFIVNADKRTEKKNQNKQYSRTRKNFSNDLSVNTTGAVFTNSSLAPIFTKTSTCQNLLPIPNVSDANITFSNPAFSTFPPLAANANANFHKFPVPTTSQSLIPPSSSQSALPFLSLSSHNVLIPPSVPSTSGNSLANFNLSTIFPEINQKGNYHYP